MKLFSNFWINLWVDFWVNFCSIFRETIGDFWDYFSGANFLGDISGPCSDFGSILGLIFREIFGDFSCKNFG